MCAVMQIMASLWIVTPGGSRILAQGHGPLLHIGTLPHEAPGGDRGDGAHAILFTPRASLGAVAESWKPRLWAFQPPGPHSHNTVLTTAALALAKGAGG